MGGSAGGSATVIIPSSFARRGFVAILASARYLPGGLPRHPLPFCALASSGRSSCGPRYLPRDLPAIYIYVMSSHKYILFWDHVSARRSAGYIYIAFRPLNFILGICHKVCRLYIYIWFHTRQLYQKAHIQVSATRSASYIYICYFWTIEILNSGRLTKLVVGGFWRGAIYIYIYIYSVFLLNKRDVN